MWDEIFGITAVIQKRIAGKTTVLRVAKETQMYLKKNGGDDETRTRDLCRDS
jgi:hypothetical protein